MRMACDSRPRIVSLDDWKGGVYTAIAWRGTNAAEQHIAVMLAEPRKQFVSFVEVVIAAKVVLIGVLGLRHEGGVIVDQSRLIRSRKQGSDFASDRIHTDFRYHVVQELLSITSHNICRIIDVDGAEISPHLLWRRNCNNRGV